MAVGCVAFIQQRITQLGAGRRPVRHTSPCHQWLMRWRKLANASYSLSSNFDGARELPPVLTAHWPAHILGPVSGSKTGSALIRESPCHISFSIHCKNFRPDLGVKDGSIRCHTSKDKVSDTFRDFQ